MSTAEFWVFLAFVFFIILFGKKCYVIVCDMLDEYINTVRNDINTAKKSNSDSQKLLDDAKRQGAEIQSKIDNMSDVYQNQTAELREFYNSSINNFEKSSEKNLQSDIDFEVESAKKELVKKIEKDVMLKLKNNFKNKKLDISVLKDNVSKIEEFLK